MGRFINPFTDFGFKFLFGREVEKELLIDFLNDLLVGEHVITDIQFQGYGEALQQQVPADFYRTAELQQRGGWMWKWFWTLDLCIKEYGNTKPITV